MIFWVFLALACVVWSRDVNHKRVNFNRSPLLNGPHRDWQMLDSYRQMINNAQEKFSNPNVKELFLDQNVDHFDPNNNDTWDQRFFYNKQYYGGKSLVFLYIGGTHTLREDLIGNEDRPFMKWAKEFGAMLFALEHRFFGLSYPFFNMSTACLELLTMEQVLADIAVFIEEINRSFKYDNPRWITIGGSYGGMLSAFFRFVHPDLTVGAYASSAPINFKLDAYEYIWQSQNAINSINPECTICITKVFNDMIQLSLSVDGRKKLSNYFDWDPPLDVNANNQDVTYFFDNFRTLFNEFIQDSFIGQGTLFRTDLNIRVLCEIMTNKTVSDHVQRAVNVVSRYRNAMGFQHHTPWFSSYGEMIRNLTADLFEMSTYEATERGSFWMICTEMGFMLSTNLGRNMFGASINLNYFIDLCTDLFGDSVKIRRIRDGNLAAQKKYKMPSGASNIIFTNGPLDPWNPFGYYATNVTAKIYCILINGTSHVADLYPPYRGEPQALPAARKQIKDYLKEFISLPSPKNAG